MLTMPPQEIRRNQFREYFYCVAFFITLAVLLAILTFHPADPSSFTLSVGVAAQPGFQNLFGATGAGLADWTVQLMGMGAPAFGALLVAEVILAYRASISKTRQPSLWLLRALGFPQLLLCYLGLLSALKPFATYKGMSFYSGGLVGQGVASFFQSGLGQAGAVLALTFGVVASLPLFLGARPMSVLIRLLSWSPSKKAKKIARDLEEEPAQSERGRTDAVPSARAAVSEKPEPVPLIQGDSAKEIRPRASDSRDEPARDVGTGDGRSPDVTRGTQGEPRIVSRREDPKMEREGGLRIVADQKAAMPRDTETQLLVDPEQLQSLISHLKFHETKGRERDRLEEETTRLKAEARQLEEKLGTFNVLGTVVHSQPGPVVNVHEFEPAPGVKVSKVIGLQDDLALGLKAQSVLMAPQPGKSTIGIEVPAAVRETVSLREIMDAPTFRDTRATLPMALGKYVDGSPLVVDLASMPHLLVAGSTGSGKSVGINVMLLSLLMRHTPRQVRFIMVDPKMLELSTYDGIGHLLMPVVTEPGKAAGALRWAIDEMERRYRLMKRLQVRSIHSFNQAIATADAPMQDDGRPYDHLPYIVVVIDELCDLMMTAPRDVEDSIQRLAQKARAAGIHLILATQRPSVDVLTGVIKANLPCRLSFQVASKHDSRTIIESIGAEKLLGKGDMLFLPPGTSRLVRSHCAFVGDKEISSVADRLRELFPAQYDSAIMEHIDLASEELARKSTNGQGDKFDMAETDGNEMDENTLYEKAVEYALEAGSVSTSSIQRQFRIGYNRAARLMDRMIRERIVGEAEAAGKPRQVLGRGGVTA